MSIHSPSTPGINEHPNNNHNFDTNEKQSNKNKVSLDSYSSLQKPLTPVVNPFSSLLNESIVSIGTSTSNSISGSNSPSSKTLQSNKIQMKSAVPQDLTKFFRFSSTHSPTPDMARLSSDDDDGSGTTRNFVESITTHASGPVDSATTVVSTTDSMDLKVSEHLLGDHKTVNDSIFEKKNPHEDDVFGLSFLRSMSEALPSLGESTDGFKLYENDDVKNKKEQEARKISVDKVFSSLENSGESTTSPRNPFNGVIENSNNFGTNKGNSNDRFDTIASFSANNIDDGKELFNDSEGVSPGQNVESVPTNEPQINKSIDQKNNSSTHRMEEARLKINAASAALNHGKVLPYIQKALKNDKHDKTDERSIDKNLPVNTEVTPLRKILKPKSKDEMKQENRDDAGKRKILLSPLTSSSQNRVHLKEFQLGQSSSGIELPPRDDTEQYTQIELKNTASIEEEWGKNVSTISTLNNELVELRKLRAKDKELIEKRDGQLQSVSFLLSKEKEIARQQQNEIKKLEQKVAGLEHVIVSDQYEVNEAYASNKIKAMEEERNKCKHLMEDLEKERNNEKDQNSKLAAQMEILQKQNSEYIKQMSKQQNNLKIFENNLDRAEILLRSEKAESEKLTKKIDVMERNILTHEKEIKSLKDEKNAIEKEQDKVMAANSLMKNEIDALQDGIIDLLDRMEGEEIFLSQTSPPKKDFNNAVRTIAILSERYSQLIHVRADLKIEKEHSEELKAELHMSQAANKDLYAMKAQMKERLQELEEVVKKEKEYSQHGYEQVLKLENDLKASKANETDSLKKIDEERRERLKLQGKIEVFDAQRSDQDEDLQIAQTKLSAAKEEILSLKALLARNQKQEIEQEAVINDQQTQLQQLQVHLESIQKSHSRTEEKNQELSKKILSLEKSIESETNRYELLLKDSDSKIEDLNKNLMKIESEKIDEQRNSSEAMKDLILKLEQAEEESILTKKSLEESLERNSSLLAKYKKALQDYESVKTKKEILEKKAESCENANDFLKEEIKHLKTSLAQCNKDLKDQTLRLEQANNESLRMRESLEKCQSDCAELRGEKETFENEAKSRQNAMESLKKEIDDLKPSLTKSIHEAKDWMLKLEKANTELSLAKESLEKSNETMSILTDKNKKLQEDYEKVKAAKEQLESEVNIRENNTNILKEEIKHLKTSLTQINTTKKGLDDLVSVLESCIDEEKDHARKLRTEICSLHDELDCYKERISRLESCIQDVTHQNLNLEGRVETMTFEVHENHQILEEKSDQLRNAQNELEFLKAKGLLKPEQDDCIDKKSNDQDESILQAEIVNPGLLFQLKGNEKHPQNFIPNPNQSVLDSFVSPHTLPQKKKYSASKPDAKDQFLNNFRKEEESSSNSTSLCVSDGILLWESKSAHSEKGIVSKPKVMEDVPTKVAFCESAEKNNLYKMKNLSRELSVSNSKNNDMLVELTALQAALEVCEADKKRFFDELNQVRKDAMDRDNERGEMVNVITELVKEIENTELERLELKNQLNKVMKSIGQDSIAIHGTEGSSQDVQPFFAKLGKYHDEEKGTEAKTNKNESSYCKQSDQFKTLYENVCDEKTALQTKLESVQSDIMEWRREFDMIKNSNDVQSVYTKKDLSDTQPNESPTKIKTHESKDDFVDLYKELAQNFSRAQKKISILEAALVDVKERARTSKEEAAAESEELRKADETAEAEARRADHAEAQLSEVLDLLDESNNELNEAVRMKCSLESQLHESLHAMHEFELGIRSNILCGPTAIQNEIGTFEETNLTGKSIHLAKFLTLYLKADLEVNEKCNREHITDAWRYLGRMSKHLSDHEIEFDHDVNSTRKLTSNVSVTSSLSNDTGRYKMLHLPNGCLESNTPIPTSISEIKVSSVSEKNRRENFDLCSDGNIEFLKSSSYFTALNLSSTDSEKPEDRYISEFDNLMKIGEFRLQNALQEFAYTSNIITDDRKKYRVEEHSTKCVSILDEAETERDVILAEALNLVESSKRAWMAESKAAEANIRTTAARELAACQQQSREKFLNFSKFMNARYNKMKALLTWKLNVERSRRNESKSNCEFCNKTINV